MSTFGIEKVDNFDFAYSVAYIRTQECLLLNKNELDRMMLAKDADDAFKVLNELDFANNKGDIKNPAEFQKIIDDDLIEIKETMMKITPNKRILAILWLDFDFHNIKTMIKAKLLGKSFEEIEPILSKMGSIKIENLKKFIFEKQHDAEFHLYNKHTEAYIKKKIEKVEKLYITSGNNPQIIDLFLDQKLMKIIYGKATDSKSEFLIDYVKKLIDLSNIKLFFRMKITGKPLDLFETAFLWHGNIEYREFKNAFEHDLIHFVAAFKNTDYSKIIDEGYKRYEKDMTLIFLEKEIENYLTTHIKKAKHMIYGPEPLIAYFLAKKNNALIIRMILINKLNGIEPEEMKERLRDLYI